MVTWNNLDTLAAFSKLIQLKDCVNIARVMTGENGAARVKKYSAPMAAGLHFNYAAKQVNDDVLAVLAQLAVPDMRACISYALHYPRRGDAVIERLDLTSVGSLSFFQPDIKTFSLLGLAYDALRVGGTMPAVLNAANEAAVGYFLRGAVGSFTDIFDLVGETVAQLGSSPDPDIDDIISADREARRAVERRLSL